MAAAPERSLVQIPGLLSLLNVLEAISERWLKPRACLRVCVCVCVFVCLSACEGGCEAIKHKKRIRPAGEVQYERGPFSRTQAGVINTSLSVRLHRQREEGCVGGGVSKPICLLPGRFIVNFSRFIAPCAGGGTR